MTAPAMTPEQQIKALSEALARLTHHPKDNPHPCLVRDCAMHPDAAVHHTPARVLGLSPNEGGTPVIGRPSPEAIEEAVTVVATSVNAAEKRRHGGWGQYVPAARAVVLDLLAAGWTPPGDGEVGNRLRRTVLDQQELIRQLGEQLSQQVAETDAAEAFRTTFLGIWFGLQEGFGAKSGAAKEAGEPEPTYTAENILRWMRKLLERSDRASARAKGRSLQMIRNVLSRDADTTPTQETLALFDDLPPAVTDVPTRGLL